MLSTTLSSLVCPKKKHNQPQCLGPLNILPGKNSGQDHLSGQLECKKCRTRYPILGGVAVLVNDVRSYLLDHAKGISQVISDEEIPKEFRREFVQVKKQLKAEHIEEDLEAERVNALYLLNHYLNTDQEWWKPLSEKGDPVMDQLIRQYWNRGPFSQISEWVAQLSLPQASAIELGCGVGGLYRKLGNLLQSYLGVDSSFISIALGRHFSRGAPFPSRVKIPEDLLQGSVSREIQIRKDSSVSSDFVVGELSSLPVKQGEWDLSISLNVIDMLDDPSLLSSLQYDLIKQNGFAIQSCPYIWHPKVAKNLRKILPKTVKTSAQAAEWLYQKSGFKVNKRAENIPWLFYKNVRQIELYSVHAFLASKGR